MFVAQNGTEYEVWLARDTGERMALLDDVRSIDYIEAINEPGRFVLVLNREIEERLLARDRRVTIYRQPAGGAMRRAWAGLLTWWQWADDERGLTRTALAGFGLTALLRRRIVAYAAGSAQAKKHGAIDDLMKAIVRENLGDQASDAARRLDAAYFRVEPDAGAGEVVTKAFAWRNVEAVLMDLSDAARQAGTEIYYAIEADDEQQLVFRTHAGQPGIDRRSSGPTLSTDDGTLLAPSVTHEYDNEINWAYAAGQGTEAERMTTLAAWQKVIEGRPVLRFGGQIGNRPGCTYGIDWACGDRVRTTYHGQTYDCLVRSVRVAVDERGAETVTARRLKDESGFMFGLAQVGRPGLGTASVHTR